MVVAERVDVPRLTLAAAVPPLLVRVPRTRRATRVWPCEPETCGRARRLVVGKLTAWSAGLPRPVAQEAVEAAELLVSELVSNAVRHTGCRLLGLEVRLCGPVARLSVVDCSRELPVLFAADDEDDHGRGMALVNKLSARWGVEVLPRGKAVWCELRLNRRTAARPRRAASPAAGGER